MIKISVGEGFAFDMLSILFVKQQKNKNNLVALKNYTSFRDEITDQIGHTCRRVRQSDEYQLMIDTNQKIFNLIDKLKEETKDRCYDEQIDNLNFERAKIKVILQKKYFPESEFTEQKFGYKDAP